MTNREWDSADRPRTPEEIEEVVIRHGECGSDEIEWDGIFLEDRIQDALVGLYNKGLIDSCNIGCKLTAKGIQARNLARS